jgi:hypothetical protein
MPALVTSGITASVSPEAEPPTDDHVDLIALDQPLGEVDRLLRIRAGIVVHQLDLAPDDATVAVDLVDVHLQRLELGVAEERRGAGDGEEGADLDRLGCLQRGGREGDRGDAGREAG